MATKWGIASAGHISHDFVTALATLPSDEHKVIAVAARDLKRAQDFATLHDIPKASSSYADLAKNPSIDVVYVGNINTQHFEVTKMMLEHGKHVLCEKPLCMNEEDTKTLVTLARQKKLVLIEAVWSRFFPAYKVLRQEIQSGTIGDIVQLNANFCIYIDAERVKRKELGGGAIFDLGVYVLQIALVVFGPKMPLAVKAVGHLNENGVDDNAAIILTYPGSKTAVLSISSLAKMTNEAVIYGTKGSIKLVEPFWCPTSIVVSYDSEDHNVEMKREFPLPPAPHKFNYQNSSGLRFEAEEMRRCIKQGVSESPLLTHEESITIAKLQAMVLEQLGVKST